MEERIMKITKYVAPVSPLDAVFDRLGFGLPAIDRFFGEASDVGEEGWSAVRLPRTNIRETDDSYVFTMEMPGLSRQNVEVNIEGDTLVVKGEKTEQSEEKGLLRREYRASRFERTFTVGNAIDRDHVKAKMEEGILTVTLPKSAEKVGRKIDVA
jgi:HSP20 family protein